ncbi:translation initiation factor 2 [Pseudomonas rubra]|uniref:Translation initiation factor 2 n=1 Tax=Pseudomonas rubra TaxID=2942627 RepID=A0ABT5P4Z6_9PSED|nr:translation initiation factor 2 [Pseudomonas rubra]MDD1013365.1 translation initiation factor 2 [Pseudomonas rubra]MDD1040516.1 translation initiation factor 2 [Pseudomonas rubra]MDD1155121.1 translation initiation factor 2 [Pseudomonas rubra]
MKALRCIGLSLCLLGGLACTSSAQAEAAPAGKAPATKSAKPAAKPKQANTPPVRKKAATKATQRSARKNAKAAPAPLPKAKLDLSLPSSLVKDMKPDSQEQVPLPKPLLPYLFGEKPPSDSPFQLNGRLISNEMQLQLRNESRKDVEGAAIEFEFKQ